MSQYFNHHYASNSDLKKIVARHEGRTEMEGIQQIFAFGTAMHAGILEPHLADYTGIEPHKIELLKEMRKTFWRDELCRKIIMAPDFKREHEFYRRNRFGLEGVRCKCDGISKKLRIILELKGLSVSTEKAFRESVEHLDYDQGAAFYLNVTDSRVSSRPDYDYKLIAGISKKEPDRMFKLLIGWDHELYKTGIQKVKKGAQVWRFYGLK